MVLLIQALQTGSQVHGVSQDGKLHFIRRPDVAYNGLSRMDSSTRREAAGSRDHTSGALHGAKRMIAGPRFIVFVGEYRQNSIADEFVHMTAIRHNNSHH